MAEYNLINQTVAMRMLQRLGCDVRIACNGCEALEMLQAEHFDLVFMDCQMPVMDGFEATGRVRALSGAVGAMPIVALTANAMESDRQDCLKAGMNDFISKPLKMQELQVILERWVRVGQRVTGEQQSVPVIA